MGYGCLFESERGGEDSMKRFLHLGCCQLIACGSKCVTAAFSDKSKVRFASFGPLKLR